MQSFILFADESISNPVEKGLVWTLAQMWAFGSEILLFLVLCLVTCKGAALPAVFPHYCNY